MKKNILIAAMCVLVATGFMSCGETDDKTELLTDKKGWVISAATSTPGYLIGEDHISNLMDGYFNDWEKDDVLYFEANGNHSVDPGTKLPPEGEDGYTTKTGLGSWKFIGDDKSKISMQLPFFYDDDPEVCNVVSLTKDEFKVRYTFVDRIPTPTKAEGDIEYTFVITYKHK